MKKACILLFLFVLPVAILAQQTITGVVRDDMGEPVIGATVQVQGTATGVITDFDGRYSISVPENSTLSFSFVGLTSQTHRVTAATSVLNVTLQTDAQVLDELVVSAMGVARERTRLNFSVQSVSSDVVTEGQQANFVNALQGRVAGLNVTNASGSPNAGTQVLIRGVSSINPAHSNEPLFVLDGTPILGGASAALDINPSDIENITILKGAAASALYGQLAANGVIMITTRQGQAGRLTATASTSWEWQQPTRLERLQTTYAPGGRGFHADRAVTGGWGPPLRDGEQVFDNVRNFLQTGLFQRYDFSLTGGTEKFQAFASANHHRHEGIVPNEFRNRTGLLMRGTFKPFETLSITISSNIVETTSRGFGTTANPGMVGVYSWPINDDIRNYRIPGTNFPRRPAHSDLEKFSSRTSPLFGRHMDDAQTTRLRNLWNASATWTPIRNLQVIGRISYDVTNTNSWSYTVPRWDRSQTHDLRPPVAPTPPPFERHPGMTDTQRRAWEAFDIAAAQHQHDFAAWQLAFPGMFYDYDNDLFHLSTADLAAMTFGGGIFELDQVANAFGGFATSSSRSEMLFANMLVMYTVELPRDFSIDLMGGSDLQMRQSISKGQRGRNFVLPGTFSMANTDPNFMVAGDRTVSRAHRNLFGHFGSIRGEYLRGLASLEVTGRWDWSSTILTNPYFYPSVTGGLTFSELLGISSDFFNFGRLRGNYAMVGKSPEQNFLFERRNLQFVNFPDGGWGLAPALTAAARDLAPEMSHSWEIGADLRFFNNRTRLDLAYYSVRTDNQILTVRVSPASGYILQTRNEGSVRNHGIEITWGQDIITNRNFSWTTDFNWGLNRGKVMSLPEDLTDLEIHREGNIFASPIVGQSLTSLLGTDYMRNDAGQVLVEAGSGLPMINPDSRGYIGDREPIFSAGLVNTFNYRGFSLSFLFDGRLGGDVVNVTGRGLVSNGNSRFLEHYRGRQVVFDGVIRQDGGTYVQNTTPITIDHQIITNYFAAISTNFIEDGSFIRLNFVTLGYDVARHLNTTQLSSLRVNFTGSNLFMLTRYTGSDPTNNADVTRGGAGAMGFDNFPVPRTRNFNLAVTATF